MATSAANERVFNVDGLAWKSEMHI